MLLDSDKVSMLAGRIHLHELTESTLHIIILCFENGYYLVNMWLDSYTSMLHIQA